MTRRVDPVGAGDAIRARVPGVLRTDERQRAALGWARAIAWGPEDAGDDLWERLHANFTEPELVELGYYMAIVYGQLRWLRTLGITPPRDELVAP